MSPTFSLSPPLSILLLAFLMLLTGCTTPLAVPSGPMPFNLPRQMYVVEQATDNTTRDSILIVQQEGEATRWTLLDLLGMPQARQILQAGRWRNDGFLPPNGRASLLFSAIAFALTPENALKKTYAGQSWHVERTHVGGRTHVMPATGKPKWSIHWAPGARDDTFSVMLPDATVWTISPLAVHASESPP